MCEREGELVCPFSCEEKNGHYSCELPDMEKELEHKHINEYCLRPHCRKCSYYQEFEDANFPLFNPKNR